MAKKKTRLQTHHASTEPQRQFAILSNTRNRVRRVLTTATTSSSHLAGANDDHSTLDMQIDTDLSYSATRSENELPAGIHVKQRAKRYQNSDAPLVTWKQYRNEYLDACIMLEGRGRYSACCAGWGCNESNAIFHCCDCFGLALYCQTCILRRHDDQPLHIIEEWSKNFFRQTTLQALGLTVQLGHQHGVPCPFRHHSHQDFVVLHVNGIHIIDINFCSCDGAQTPRDQLLEVGWWPSTPLDPKSAASMDVLRLFHILNLQGQLAPTDFYRSLEQMTCGDGLRTVPDRLPQRMLMVRQWRHLKMAKRAGRGHDPVGIDVTAQGALSIPCRACPHPNINLPDGWEKCCPEDRWLYALFLAEDANFKQKARIRSGNEKDPALGPGWGTFVENQAYLTHVAKFADQDEISHCVGFAALWNANTKRSKGLRATGIGSVSCARHEMYRPNGMGDLQKGERYANMDYLFLSSVIGTVLAIIILSYDIACQWGLNLFSRMRNPSMPEMLHLPTSTSVRLFVPKFHLPAHTPKCHAPYSFNFAPGVGRTDSEGVERNWSVLNGIAPSVSMMGPGGRWDTLDDFCNYSNRRKTITLPSTLLRKMTLAIPQAVIHHRALSAFTESLQVERAKELKEWEEQVRKWESDKVLPSPYDLPEQKVTFAQVKYQLSREEHEQVEKGEIYLNIGDMSPSAFVVAALELEENQQVLLADLRASAQTASQQTSIQRRRTELLKRIRDFRAVQNKYMPGLEHYLAGLSSLASEGPSAPELIPLLLPSSIPDEQRSSVCLAGIPKIEDRLRFAQASEALVKLRCQLMKRSYASRYKVQNVSSQRYYTRFQTLQDHTEFKIKEACRQYTTARHALLKLRGPGIWQQLLRELQPSDVRGLSDKALVDEERAETRKTRVMAGLQEEDLHEKVDDFENLPVTMFHPRLAVGDGFRTLSWIWCSTTSGEANGSLSTEPYLRVEWLKCRARAARWKEELQLLEEEMRRAIQFCESRVTWWKEQAQRRSPTSPHLAEGLVAYAAEQAAIEHQRVLSWTEHWAAVRQRAVLILGQHLNNQEDSVDIPVLEVEIEDEDHDEDLMFDLDDA